MKIGKSHSGIVGGQDIGRAMMSIALSAKLRWRRYAHE